MAFNEVNIETDEDLALYANKPAAPKVGYASLESKNVPRENYAKAKGISRKLGIDEDLIARNIDTFKAIDGHEEKVNRIIANNPKLEAFFSKPSNHKLSEDHLESVEDIALYTNRAMFAPIGDGESVVPRALKTGWNHLQANLLHSQAMSGIGDIDEISNMIAAKNKRAEELESFSADYVKESKSSWDRSIKSLDSGYKKIQGSFGKLREGKVSEALNSFKDGTIQDSGELLNILSGTLNKNQWKGLFYSNLEQLASSSPAMAIPAVTSGAGALIGSRFGLGKAGAKLGYELGTFISSAVIEHGASIDQYLNEAGYNTKDADKIKSAYANKDFIEDVNGKAGRKALVQGTVDTVFNSMGIDLAKSTMAKTALNTGAKKTIEGIKGVAKEVALQSVGEGVGQGVSDIAAQGKSWSPGEAFQESVMSLGQSFSDVAITRSIAGTKEGAGKISEFFSKETDSKLKKSKVKAAEHVVNSASEATGTVSKASSLHDLNETLKKSQLFKESKEAVEEIVRSVSDQDVSSVFFNAEDFEDHFASNGDSPLDKAAELMGDNGEAYTQAKKMGGSIEIPLEKLVGSVGGTDQYNVLLNKAKFSHEGPTVQDSMEILKRIPEELKKIAEFDFEDGKVTYTGVKKDDSAGSSSPPLKQGLEIAKTSPLQEELKRRIEQRNISGVNIKAPLTTKENKVTDNKEFKDWFGDSKVIDADGNPLVVYHGTSNSGFNEFDAYGSNYGLFGKGVYVTDDPEIASSYTKKGRGTSPGVYQLFLSIKNPIDMDAPADLSKWKKAFDNTPEGIDYYAFGDPEDADYGSKVFKNEKAYRVLEDAYEGIGYQSDEAAQEIQDALRDMGYDGITHIGGGRVKSEGKKHRVFIAFDPEQIKSIPKIAGDGKKFEGEIKRSLAQTNIGKGKIDDTAFLLAKSFDTIIKRLGISEDQFQSKFFPNIKQLTDKEEKSFIRKALSSLSKETNIDPGSIKGFFEANTTGLNINLFRKADFKTFVHEMGHYYLEVIRMAASDNESFKRDLNDIYQYLGANEGEALTRDQEEKLAKTFELYIRSGIAPNRKLQMAFSRFKEWLKGLYTVASERGIEINEEIRSVFDRLFAVEEDIADNIDDDIQLALFESKEDAGMTDEEYASYIDNVEGARQKTIDDVVKEGMSVIDLNLPPEVLEEKNNLKKDLKVKLNEDPAYIAKWALMKDTQPNGTKLESQIPLRLKTSELLKVYDRDKITQYVNDNYKQGQNDVVDKYHASLIEKYLNGNAIPDELKSQLFTYSLPKIHTNTGNISLDFAAEYFGFDNSDQMINGMKDIPDSFKQAVDMKADAMIRLKYGDIIASGEVSEALRRQIINKDFIEKSKKEFSFLLKKLSPDQKLQYSIPSKEYLYKSARDYLDKIPVSQLDLRRHINYSIKAFKDMQAFYQANDIESAAIAAKKGIYANEVGRVIVEIQKEYAENLKRIKRNMAATSLQKVTRGGVRVNINFIGALESILQRFGLKKLKNNQEFFDLNTLVTSINNRSSIGVIIPDEFFDSRYNKSYQDMNINEFQDLHDAIVSIANVAKSMESVFINGKIKDLESLENEGSEIINRIGLVATPKSLNTDGYISKAAKGTYSFFMSHIKLAMDIAAFDSFKDTGFFHDNFIFEINRKSAEDVERKNFAAESLKNIFNKHDITVQGLKEKTHYDILGETLTAETRIMIGMNMRSENNYIKLLAGYNEKHSARFNEYSVKEIIDDLSVNEIGFINDIGDFFESFYPEMDALNRRVQGIPLNKVKGKYTKVKNGIINGGYTPIRLNPEYMTGDKNRAGAAYIDEVDQYNKSVGGIRQHNPRSTSRKQRVEFHTHPIRLDMKLIQDYVSEVTHDLVYTETLSDFRKIINSDKIQKSIIDSYGYSKIKRINKHIDDIGDNQIISDRNATGALNYVRKGVQTFYLGLSFGTGVKQTFGLTMAMADIGIAPVLKTTIDYIANPKKMNKFAKENSNFMKNRTGTQTVELRELMSKEIDIYSKSMPMFSKDAPVAVAMKIKNKLVGTFFQFAAATQFQTDVITWTSAYNKALSEGLLLRATDIADNAVIETQGSGVFSNLSAIEKNESSRFINMFYTFANQRANLTYKNFNKLQLENPGWSPKATLKKASKISLYLMLAYGSNMLLNDAYRKAMSDKDDEEEDKNSVLDNFFVKLAFEGLGDVAFARELSRLGSPYPYKGPMIVTPIAKLYDLSKKLQKDDNEFTDKEFKSVLEIVGSTSGILPNQVIKTFFGAKALADDETDDPLALIRGR